MAGAAHDGRSLEDELADGVKSVIRAWRSADHDIAHGAGREDPGLYAVRDGLGTAMVLLASALAVPAAAPARGA